MKKNYLKEPIRLCVFYMLATLVAYYISPVEYNTYKPLLLSAVVSLYILCFYAGYCSNIHIKRSLISKPERVDDNTMDRRNLQWLNTAIVVNFIYIVVTLVNNLSLVGISNLSVALATAFSDANSLYMAKVHSYNAGTSTIINSLTILGSPIYTYAFVIGGYNFTDLKKQYKVLYISGVVLEAMKWLVMGTNKGVFDTAGLIVLVVLFRRWSNKTTRKRTAKTPKKRIFIRVAMILSALFALYVLNMTISSRMLSDNLSTLYGNGVKAINTDSIFFKILPNQLSIALCRIFGYFSSAYYGFSLCLSEPWMPTFFLGSSGFIRQYIGDLLNVNIIPRLYQTRIEQDYGWSSNNKWHTMYTWMANDVSVIGVTVIMFILGKIFRNAIDDGVAHDNPYALCVAYQILMVVFYSPANNQILGSGSGIMSLLVFLFLWHRRKTSNSRTKLIRQTWPKEQPSSN